MKEVSEELYDAFVKLLNSKNAKTRYHILIALLGFDSELPDFISVLEERLKVETIPVVKGLLKQTVKEAENHRVEEQI